MNSCARKVVIIVGILFAVASLYNHMYKKNQYEKSVLLNNEIININEKYSKYSILDKTSIGDLVVDLLNNEDIWKSKYISDSFKNKFNSKYDLINDKIADINCRDINKKEIKIGFRSLTLPHHINDGIWGRQWFIYSIKDGQLDDLIKEDYYEVYSNDDDYVYNKSTKHINWEIGYTLEMYLYDNYDRMIYNCSPNCKVINKPKDPITEFPYELLNFPVIDNENANERIIMLIYDTKDMSKNKQWRVKWEMNDDMMFTYIEYIDEKVEKRYIDSYLEEYDIYL